MNTQDIELGYNAWFMLPVRNSTLVLELAIFILRSGVWVLFVTMLWPDHIIRSLKIGFGVWDIVYLFTQFLDTWVISEVVMIL